MAYTLSVKKVNDTHVAVELMCDDDEMNLNDDGVMDSIELRPTPDNITHAINKLLERNNLTISENFE